MISKLKLFKKITYPKLVTKIMYRFRLKKVGLNTVFFCKLLQLCSSAFLLFVYILPVFERWFYKAMDTNIQKERLILNLQYAFIAPTKDLDERYHPNQAQKKGYYVPGPVFEASKHVFTPALYQEIVGERNISNYCGLPTCPNLLCLQANAYGQSSALTSKSNTGEASPYLLDIKHKKIMKRVPTEYCSDRCLMASKAYAAQLEDASLPFNGCPSKVQQCITLIFSWYHSRVKITEKAQQKQANDAAKSQTEKAPPVVFPHVAADVCEQLTQDTSAEIPKQQTSELAANASVRGESSTVLSSSNNNNNNTNNSLMTQPTNNLKKWKNPSELLFSTSPFYNKQHPISGEKTIPLVGECVEKNPSELGKTETHENACVNANENKATVEKSESAKKDSDQNQSSKDKHENKENKDSKDDKENKEKKKKSEMTKEERHNDMYQQLSRNAQLLGFLLSWLSEETMHWLKHYRNSNASTSGYKNYALPIVDRDTRLRLNALLENMLPYLNGLLKKFHIHASKTSLIVTECKSFINTFTFRNSIPHLSPKEWCFIALIFLHTLSRTSLIFLKTEMFDQKETLENVLKNLGFEITFFQVMSDCF
ncbi:hypothetical protein RFI_15955, partial [Reticulomyxa filosa]